ncbi:sensor histidine kinase [Clostridium rectalis]|uniref:sensor histidine kinase n=1 Tax=Clostridium rectalis TaxID=2040295 RepID=UPI0013DE3C60|nr:GAF domain-containing sensor histidine kinase [Clostridium rectalis]
MKGDCKWNFSEEESIKKIFHIKNIDMEDMINNLLRVSIINSKAEKGYLIKQSDKGLFVNTKVNMFENETEIIPLNFFNDIPKSIIYYVAETLKTVVLENALKDNKFSNDKYVSRNKIKSVLCMPVIFEGDLKAILYLENNIYEHVFDLDKIKIIQMLWSHAVISIENKFMYNTVEKLNEKLERKVKKKNKLLKEVVEYDKLKTEFFANISHELKTPVNVIFSAIQMCNLIVEDLDGENKLKLCKYTNMMKQNCYRLVRLINNIIDITKIDSGYFKIQLKNEDIITVIEDITMSIVDYSNIKGIDIIFDTDVEEKVIACDPDKIERIMLNLLSNSIKFTNEGGKIFVNIKEKNEYIQISVKDTGIGIPKEKQSSIFERFTQVDKSLSRNNEGSGIGLSLVKALVDMHKGKVYLNKEYTNGCEFIIEFPNTTIRNENKDFYLQQQSNVEKIKIEFSDIYL